MILAVGEILFDIFPDDKRLGGAPFNFAFHLKKLGFDVRFVSRVGNDDPGKEILDFLDSHGFDTQDIQVDPGYPTGRVDVAMDDQKNHSFEIIQNMAYDHLEYDTRLDNILKKNPDLIYFGTLIQRTRTGSKAIEALLKNKPASCQAFCDINLRPDCWTNASVDACLARADLLKINNEELITIAPTPLKSCRYPDIVQYLMQKYQIAVCLLTLGKDGCIWFTPDRAVAGQPVDASVAVKDTVGAGDAFAAMAMAGYLSGFNTQKTLRLAQDFAGRICEINGALPETDEFYHKYVAMIGEK